MIELILSISANNILGIKGINKLLWDSDVVNRFFRKNTLGSVVVMGNNTFKAVERPLTNRTNIVLSKTIKPGERNGVTYYDNIQNVMSDYPSFYVIGGGEIITAFFPFIDQIKLATISLDIGGREEYIFFPSDAVDEEFYQVQESAIIKDKEKISGLQSSIIFSKWRRDIETLH